MPDFDVNKVPKQFCENAMAARSAESFTLGLFSGGTAAFFAFSPEHFKRLVKNLSYQLAEYERQFGLIETQWAPGVQSPIQAKDVLDKGNGSS